MLTQHIQELMIKTTVIHDAMPLSYKLPDSSVVVNDMRKDKFYHHKKLKFMCRSRKEVKKFELEGVRPKRPGKAKKDQNVKPDNPMINVTPSKKRTFDEGSSRLSPLEFSQSSSSFWDFARSSISFGVSSSSLSVPESGRSSNSFIPPENDIIYIPAEEPAHSVEELLKDSYNNLINGVLNPNSDSDATLDGHEEDQEQPDPLSSVEQFLVDSLCNLHKASTTTPKPKESKDRPRKFQQKEKGRNLSAKAEDATELFDVPVHFEFEPKNEN
ncbi:hypothetical protein L484_025460 [Morus notabilis]|uniref:Uncharacterized protein n=1 Tax=Morus notabilis TaxID=981085 RepID=W9SD84_9ROSA|nr:hypothetical protein L484_025460 [Morus notabilis]